MQRDTPGYMHRDLVKRSEGQTGAKGNYQAVVADDDEQKRLKAMAAQFNFVLDMALKDVCRGEVKERDVLFISGFEVLDDAWDEEDPSGSSKDGPWTGSFGAVASPETPSPVARAGLAPIMPGLGPQPDRFHRTLAEEDLSPLLGGFVQGEGSVNASLQTAPGFEAVLEAYQIIYISGENWLCFVRSILMALGRAEQTLLQVHKQLRTIYGTGLIEVLGKGVETGSPLAEAILQAIFDVTGNDVGLTLVIPEKGGPPKHRPRQRSRRQPGDLPASHGGALQPVAYQEEIGATSAGASSPEPRFRDRSTVGRNGRRRRRRGRREDVR